MGVTENQLNTSYWRISVSLLPGVLLAGWLMLVSGPIAQPPGYHLFADQRIVLHIPHFGDVLSSLAFIVVGGWGLWFLSRPQLLAGTFLNSLERRNYWWLFTGVFLTGFGSGWYHFSPDNYSLVWDRLPMSLAFMSVFAVMLSERVNPALGFSLLRPMLAVGVASVLWWIWTEHAGHGDLRLYLIVQFYPMISMVLMLLLLPTPYTHSKYYWGLFYFYIVAKIAEILDHQIYELTGSIISGHNLKHLFAAMAVAWLLRMLWLRQAGSGMSKTAS